ncbi:MAG: hypothetical protein Q9188_000931 [Gyalolechia gomerana]
MGFMDKISGFGLNDNTLGNKVFEWYPAVHQGRYTPLKKILASDRLGSFRGQNGHTLLTHNAVAAIIGLPGGMTDQRPGPDQATKQYTDHSWWHVTDFQDMDEPRLHDLREPDEKSIRRANQRKQAEYISERRKRGRERGEERATQAAEGDTEESEFWSKTPET